MTRTDNPEAPVPEDHGVDRALRIITAATLVLAILALFPWTNDPATTIKFFILHWGAAIMAALWLYGVWTGRKPLGRPGLMGGFLLAFLVINLAAALTSDHVANSLNAWSDLAVVGLLFLFAASAYHTPKQVWRLLAAIAVATALSSVYGFCQRAGLDPFPWATTDVEEYRGLPATFGNPNMASHTLNLAVIMAIALTFRKGTRWCIVPAGLIGAHIVFTEVRAAKVALIAAGVLVAIVFYLRRRRPAPARGALATIVILILLAGIAVGGAMGLTYWRTGSPFPLDRSILLRYNGYLGASQMIADRPALGFGPGNYPLDNPPYWTNYERERFATKPLINAHVHNDYLQAGVEGGAAAAACYIGLLTAALVSALAMAFTTGGPSRRALGLALSACLAAFAVDGLFGFTVHVPASAALFFVLAGAVQGVMGHQAAVHAGDRPKRWARLCGASVCVLALALLCMGTRVFMAQYYFQAARAARYYERFDAAYANLAKGERLAPWDFEFPRQMALLDLNNARTPAAIERMQRSLALRPHDVPGSVILGKAYLNTAIAAIQAQGGQAAIDEALDKAVDAANAALEICPALPNAHALLGRVALVRAQLLPPSDPPSAESLAAYATAKEHLQTALVSAPSDPAQVNTMLATAYASLGETSQALAALKRAARLDPRSDEMWRLYVQMTKTSGKWKPLVNSLETAIEDLYNADPPEPQTAAALALTLADAYREGSGDPDAAATVLRRALESVPGRLDIWGVYAEILRELDQKEALLTAIHEAEQQSSAGGPLLPPVLSALEGALTRGGAALTRAITKLREAGEEGVSKASPEAARRGLLWIANMLGSLVMDADMPDEQRGEALHELGFAFLLMQAWEPADVTLLYASRAAAPERKVLCELQRTEALLQRGYHIQAIALALQVVRQKPDMFYARHQYARILAATGTPDQAREEYQYILDNLTIDEKTRQLVQTELEALANSPAPPGGAETP